MNEAGRRATPEELLRDLGLRQKLTVFLAAAPGAGKTRRLLTDARSMLAAGTRAMIGWIETKGRLDLERLAAGIPRIPPRAIAIQGAWFEDFDFEAALAARPQVVILDELPHANLPGGAHAKRWEDALALRERGIGVLTAFNIQHLETAAPAAERILGYPVREIVPQAFLDAADAVIAIDVSPELLHERVRAGLVFNPEDAERALAAAFRPQALLGLQDLLLRTIDDLTVPVVEGRRVSAAIAVVPPGASARSVAMRAADLAAALDLSLAVTAPTAGDDDALVRAAADFDAQVLPWPLVARQRLALGAFNASLVIIPRGASAATLVSGPMDRDVFVVDAMRPDAQARSAPIDANPLAQTAGDRLRIGYGKLTVYLGACAGSGKTYSMLERAHQLQGAGVDVVVAFVETHGRPETEALLAGLEILPRATIDAGSVRYEELDRQALLARKPAVALIDEFAHTNPPGSEFAKRYQDVLSVLRSGISVMTTLNIQHLEGLGDPVARMTGIRVRETLPDRILDLADEIIFIDCPPEVIRERLRQGKVYTAERVEVALTHFFRTENLAALRELALREALRVRKPRRGVPLITRLLLGVAARERDLALVHRIAGLAARLEIGFTVAHVSPDRERAGDAINALREATRDLRGRWLLEESPDPIRTLVAAAERDGASTIAVEGARTKPRLFHRPSVARRLLDAGARELLVLTPAKM